MEFILLTDLHERDGMKRWAFELCEDEQPEGVIFLGDVVNYSGSDPMPDRKHTYVKEFLRDLTTLTETVYFVPGNNDMRESLIYAEEEEGVVCLHHHRHELGPELGVVGKGGSLPIPGASGFPFEHEADEDQRERLVSLSQEGDIWALHEPVRGYRDLTAGGSHAGNPDYLDAFEEAGPAVVMSGHIHEATGIEEKSGCKFINPGPLLDGVAGRMVTGDPPNGDSVTLELIRK